MGKLFLKSELLGQGDKLKVYTCTVCGTFIPFPQAPHPPCHDSPAVAALWDAWDNLVQWVYQWMPSRVEFV